MSTFSAVRDEASAPFFDATAQGTLLIRRCPVCGTTHGPQQERCVHRDGIEATEWVQASGTGVLVSWAVDHAPPLDPVLAAPDGTRSVYGIVELSEGVWLAVPIVGTDPADLAVGVAVRVVFVTPGEGEAVPAFTRA
jgi:uncharacterized OB-fold protein